LPSCRVRYSSERRGGKGKLPEGTLSVSGEGDLERHVERQLAARSRDLAERLQR
jgi:hypothetical protein